MMPRHTENSYVIPPYPTQEPYMMPLHMEKPDMMP